MATRPIPEELLQQMFQNIDSPLAFRPQSSFARICERMRVRTLRNICLASRACHRIASPILYKKFMHFVEPPRLLHRNQRSILYLKSILSNPQNALALEHLQLPCQFRYRGDGSGDFCDLMADRTLRPEQKARFKWIVQVIISRSDGNDLGKLLKQEWEAAVLAMILLHCPNITKLEMRMPVPSPSGVFLYCLTYWSFSPPARAALESGKAHKNPVTGVWHPPVLRALKEATLMDPGNNTDVRLEVKQWMLNLMSLPTMSKLRVGGLGVGFGPITEEFPNITSLQLDDWQLPIPYLNDLLKSCTCLSTFRLGWYDYLYKPIPSPWEEESLTDVTHVLLKNVTGLNSFTVKDSRRACTDTDGRFVRVLGRPMGLMENLTYLSTRESNIWGYDSGTNFFDCLPTSLVELEICRSGLDLLAGSTKSRYQYRDWRIRHDVDLRTLALRFEYENLRRITMTYENSDLAPQIELDEQLEERGWNLTVIPTEGDVGWHTLERAPRA